LNFRQFFDGMRASANEPPQVIWLTKTAEDELAHFFAEQACSLFDEAEV
jgi:hypothetical protein